MKVLLRNPRRELEVPGPVAVHALLERLAINRESVSVIRSDTLITCDAVLHDDDVVDASRADLRPCSSCGSATRGDTCAFCKLRARAGAASS